MTDVRTMRSYLDLLAERDEALAEATRLADLADGALTALTRAVLALSSAERRDPFHGHHPEHPTPQAAAQ